MKSNAEEQHLYVIARVSRAGADVGVVYAAELPCDRNTLLAEVVGGCVRLHRASDGRHALAELSLSELVALACACRAWESARVGFSSIRHRVRAPGYGGLIVQPADPSSVVTRRPVSPWPVAPEVLQVAELRVSEGHARAGDLAGALYVIPNDWTLEALERQAVLVRGTLRLELGVEDGLFLQTLAATLTARASTQRVAGTKEQPVGPKPDAADLPPGTPAREMTDEEVAAAFRI